MLFFCRETAYIGHHCFSLCMEYPKDVQEIIEYTKLRKKYPVIDRKLRNILVNYFHEEMKNDRITMDQMRSIMKILKKKDEGEK